MVNRCRSTGFFLTLWCLVLLPGCSGSNSSNPNVSPETPSTTVETDTDAVSVVSTSPVKIMAIGDSITQADSSHKSYRYALWKKLIDTGVAFDMMGSMQGNFKGDPSWPDYKLMAFDRDHEGHWGIRVDEVLTQIETWLSHNSPDVALIHLGTNDIFQAQSVNGTLDELTQLIARFRSNNAQIAVMLAQVIPSKFHQTELAELNIGIADLAQKLNTSESPIYLVDTGAGLDPEIDTYDGVHPNDSGEQKMADNWIEGLTDTNLFQ